MMLLLLTVLAGSQDPLIIDIAKLSRPLELFSDGQGHYVAVDRFDPGAGNADLRYGYYGDGKVFTEATLRGPQISTDEPRYPPGTVLLSPKGSELNVSCGERVTTLARVAPAERDAILAKAVFKRSPVDFVPYTLARDDKGIYYFATRGRYSDNEGMFRVYIGPRGAMKEQKLTNIVHDSAGDIFATAKGDLRLITGNPGRSEWWRGSTHSVLTDVPIFPNLQMIFNDLGPYKKMRLGTPCDDL